MRLSRCVLLECIPSPVELGGFQVWKCLSNGLELLTTIKCTHGAVLSFVTQEDLLYAAYQDGYVRVWDMQTKTFIRTVIVQEVSTRLLVVLFVDVLIACRMWTFYRSPS